MTPPPPLPSMDDSLLDALPVPACIFEAQSGLIVRCNPGAVALWGQRPLDGTRIHDVLRFVRPDGTPLPDDETPIATAVAAGVATSNQRAVIARHGQDPVYVSLNILPFVSPQRTREAGLIVFHGVSARKRRDVLLTGQKNALEMMVGGAPLSAILDTLTGIVDQQAGGMSIAAIMLLAPDGQHLRHAGSPRLPDHFKNALDELEIGSGFGTCTAATRLRRVVVTEDIETAPEWSLIAHLPLALGLRAVWAVPIVSSTSRVLGAFSIYLHERRGPSPQERELVELLSHTAAIAIERQQVSELDAEAGRRKDEFLAMLAHELRNPLAPIRTAAQLLGFAAQDASITGKVQSVIERQVENMTRLIDDLLDVSRITRGAVELRMVNIDVAQITARAIETVAPLIDSRGHHLTVTVPPGPVIVCVDGTRMEQVIVNLLTNAAKFTPPRGQITVTVTEQGDDAVAIRVTDNGRGIVPILLPRVFDMFTQGIRALDRSEGGLGIGLTVAHRLVEMHGGSLRARSDGAGAGSEFTVTLPRAVGEAEPEPEVRALGPVHPRKILVVEDQRDAADMLAMLLTAQSHDVRVAADGPAALVAVAAFKPDVMLIDIGLPGMSGYDLAERIRQDRALASVVLVAVTGYGGPQDRIRALSCGFDHHVVKPVDERALAELLSDPGQPTTVAPPESTCEPSEPSDK